MELTLKRVDRRDDCTIGELYVDGVFECWTLEDRDRMHEGLPKLKGGTAIPRGTYSVHLSLSKRFGTVLPLLQNVPEFEGVRIHAGNSHKDTEACILVGCKRGPNWIAESKLALSSLMSKLLKADKITITVS